MSEVRHRPGVDPNSLVVRRLRVSGVGEEEERAIALDVASLIGVDSVCWSDPGRLLEVAYDSVKCRLADVESVLASHGGRFVRGWRMRLECSWYRFVEQNIRDNAQHVPHCCNKPPV